MQIQQSAHCHFFSVGTHTEAASAVALDLYTCLMQGEKRAICDRVQGRAETFGGAGAQSIKGAHGTLLIGLCCLLICVSKWMLLY